MAVDFVLNGKPVRVEEVDPQESLLQWLRKAGLCGTKEGCAEGECGACAVAVLEPDAEGRAALHAVNSCLLPVAALSGRTLVSVEGVARARGQLHPVQQALADAGGSQCGYCTPGFAISLFCEYYRRDRSGYDAEAISGNLCRCTGYRPIIDAAKQLSTPAPDDPVLEQLASPPPAAPAIEHRGAGRRYLRPLTVTQALQHAAQAADATFIAGGTDLMAYANLQGRRYNTLIALDAIAELRELHALERELSIGAALPLSLLERRLEPIADAPAILAQLWPLFSSRLIRNRATLGGNLATASPIGDGPVALLALDASLGVASERGERRVPLRDFFTGYRATALQPAELIARIYIPRGQPSLQRFYKVSKRKLDDISAVAGAFCLELDDQRCVRQLRVAYGGIAATPVRALDVEQLAVGQPWSRATLAALQAELLHVGTPISDLRASAAYRRAMIGKLFEKFFDESSEPAASGAAR